MTLYCRRIETTEGDMIAQTLVWRLLKPGLKARASSDCNLAESGRCCLFFDTKSNI